MMLNPVLSKPEAGQYRLGIDIGGTFTDLILVDGSGTVVGSYKLLTTPRDLASAAAVGTSALLSQIGLQPKDVCLVIHATTQTSNTVIERSGARTALITTRGFRDILEFGRENRYDVYDLGIKIPAPLVTRPFRFEVSERTNARGQVLHALDEAEVQFLARQLDAKAIEAVAICLLHAYMNPIHERAIRRLLSECGYRGAIVLSSDVCPEIREYERTVTTVLNAYLMPRIRGYLSGFRDRLEQSGLAADVSVFSSYGGRLRLEPAMERPVELLECGAAAGVLAAAMVARTVDWATALSFDMGGTTAKAAIIRNGAPALARRYEVARVARFTPGSGLPVAGSAIDIIEIGAGGGSIARVNELGLVAVGPESAGSEPGPACYGRGGIEPTVADADLVLGYLAPDGLLEGHVPLSRQAAESAIVRAIAQPLGISVEEAAASILEIVVESMARAARMHAVEHGYDPRTLNMIAFGGAGPVHAAAVAHRLGVRELLVMPDAGVGAAVGLALAAPGIIVTRSRLCGVEALDWREIEALYREMESEARGTLGSPTSERLESHFSADMRFSGQGYEVDVPFVTPPFAADANARLLDAFALAYRARYGRDNPGARAEVVSWRLELRGRNLPAFRRQALNGASIKPEGRRQAWLGGAFVEVPIYRRARLPIDSRLAGPALVAEAQTTTVIPPDSVFFVDESANLRIQFEG